MQPGVTVVRNVAAWVLVAVSRSKEVDSKVGAVWSMCLMQEPYGACAWCNNTNINRGAASRVFLLEKYGLMPILPMRSERDAQPEPHAGRVWGWHSCQGRRIPVAAEVQRGGVRDSESAMFQS